jgi:hypothetical protein
MSGPYASDEQLLVDVLDERALRGADLTDTSRALERWRVGRRRGRHSLRLVAVAAAIVAVTAGVVLVSTGSAPSRGRVENGSGPLRTWVTQVLPAPASLRLTSLSGPVAAGSVAFGAIWAMGDPGDVYRVSLDGRHVLSALTLPPRYASPRVAYRVFYVPQRAGAAMLLPVHGASGADGYVVLDRRGHQTGFLPVQVAGAVAGGPVGGWIQTAGLTLAQVDAHLHRTGVGVTLPGLSADNTIRTATVSGTALWVAVEGTTPTLFKLDARTGDVLGRIALAGNPFAVAASDSAVYIGDDKFRMERFDAASLKLTAISTNLVDKGSFVSVAVGVDGSVWIEPDTGGVVQLDPRTLLPTGSWQVLHDITRGDTWGLVVTPDRLVINDFDHGRLLSFARP